MTPNLGSHLVSALDVPAAPASECDILIIGGGPAGSTAAIALAEKGYRVVVVEKARHPRFHIGESLLPANMPILEKLGVAEKVRSIGMEKWGAEFVSPSDGRRQEFHFADAWNKSMPMAYQVRRSEFDEILIRRAAECGAEVVEGCRVRDLEFLDGGPVRVHAQDDAGQSRGWLAGRVIDASGRDTFLGNRLRAKRRNAKHGSAAMYAHFTGVRRDSGRSAGNITIYWFDHGWFWCIPLADGTTSIGAVVWPHYLKGRSVPLREFFMSAIASCPPMGERLADATMVGEVQATGNYSYSCTVSHGRNFLMIGDAFAFIDPVFSSGVMLAMNGGIAAAETLDICLKHPARSAAALKKFDRLMHHGPKEFSWFIYRVTNPTMREIFLEPRNFLRMQEALLSVLAGDVFQGTPIWTSLRLFKGLYYLISMANLKRTLSAMRKRAVNIRAVETEPMTGA